MIVILMCCGLVCGCLTENNKEIQCPHSYINVERVAIEVCGKPDEPIECDYCKKYEPFECKHCK